MLLPFQSKACHGTAVRISSGPQRAVWTSVSHAAFAAHPRQQERCPAAAQHHRPLTRTQHHDALLAAALGRRLIQRGPASLLLGIATAVAVAVGRRLEGGRRQRALRRGGQGRLSGDCYRRRRQAGLRLAAPKPDAGTVAATRLFTLYHVRLSSPMMPHVQASEAGLPQHCRQGPAAAAQGGGGPTCSGGAAVARHCSRAARATRGRAPEERSVGALLLFRAAALGARAAMLEALQ